MEITNANFFVWEDMDNDVVYTSKSLEPIIERNEYFPIAVWGVIPTESGDKMISVELKYDGEPFLQGGMFGVFLHWDYYIKSKSDFKQIEL